jgi:hypothetical protein
MISGYAFRISFSGNSMGHTLKQTLFAMMVGFGLALTQPIARAQYVTDQQQAQQAARSRIEQEHAFYRELEGQTFWFQPGSSMRARFYPKFEKFASGEIYLPAGTGFAPVNTVSFTIEKYISSQIKDYGPPTHVYQVKIEDGTVAFMSVNDFGTPIRGFGDTRDIHLTADPRTVASFFKEYNDKILTKSPDLIITEEQERKRLKAEAAEKAEQERKQLLAARESEHLQTMAKEKAAAAAQKRKGGARIGMTTRQVLNSSWGKPSDINRTTTAAGVNEQWVYGNSSYLYFTNGILTAVQN